MDKQTESAIRQLLALIEPDYDVERAIVYGSRARGTHRPDSDADLAILLNGPPRPFLSTAFAMSDVAYDIFLDTGIDISPLPIWLDEWRDPDSYSNPALLHAIANEGIRL